jgi:hypothetical protein
VRGSRACDACDCQVRLYNLAPSDSTRVFGAWIQLIVRAGMLGVEHTRRRSAEHRQGCAGIVPYT